MPGRPVLTIWLYLRSRSGGMLRLQAKHQLLPLRLRLHGLRGELRDIGDEGDGRGETKFWQGVQHDARLGAQRDSAGLLGRQDRRSCRRRPGPRG